MNSFRRFGVKKIFKVTTLVYIVTEDSSMTKDKKVSLYCVKCYIVLTTCDSFIIINHMYTYCTRNKNLEHVYQCFCLIENTEIIYKQIKCSVFR